MRVGTPTPVLTAPIVRIVAIVPRVPVPVPVSVQAPLLVLTQVVGPSESRVLASRVLANRILPSRVLANRILPSRVLANRVWTKVRRVARMPLRVGKPTPVLTAPIVPPVPPSHVPPSLAQQNRAWTQRSRVETMPGSLRRMPRGPNQRVHRSRSTTPMPMEAGRVRKVNSLVVRRPPRHPVTPWPWTARTRTVRLPANGRSATLRALTGKRTRSTRGVKNPWGVTVSFPSTAMGPE